MGVKKWHRRTDMARERMQHERADTAQESGHGTRERTRHKRADTAQRDNKARVSKGKTIKKKTYMSCGQTGAVTEALMQPEEARRGVDEAWSRWCQQSVGTQHNGMEWHVSCK